MEGNPKGQPDPSPDNRGHNPHEYEQQEGVDPGSDLWHDALDPWETGLSTREAMRATHRLDSSYRAGGPEATLPGPPALT